MKALAGPNAVMEQEYQSLRALWLAGDRDRENALRLLFLTWMHWADPDFVTGMSEDPEARKIWQQLFDHFGGESSTDAEFLHVTALMVSMFPWFLGDEQTWQGVGARMTARARKFTPWGFPLEHFQGRSSYGEYFAHQARCN